MVQVKICGIKTPETLEAAAQNGARFVGFVFYPPSPRSVEADTAKELALMLPTGVKGVGLFVDPTDDQLEAVLGKVQLDMIQLHGEEAPQRIMQIKERFSMPIIKAIAVMDLADIQRAQDYDAADWLLFDTKMPNSNISGGSGHAFDWSLLSGQTFSKPWMLSGGLNAKNIKQVLESLSPDAVDVSSGVETIRGVKDADKIKAFIRAAKSV